MKKILIFLIDVYQKFVSPLIKPSCVFFPTCSDYAKDAIRKYGPWKGSVKSVWRVMRCHPWQKNRIDPA
jgi:uncharacterized protein